MVSIDWLYSIQSSVTGHPFCRHVKNIRNDKPQRSGINYPTGAHFGAIIDPTGQDRSFYKRADGYFLVPVLTNIEALCK